MLEQAKNICITILSKIQNPTTKDINSAIEKTLLIYPELEAEKINLYNYLSSIFSIFSDDYRILDTDTGFVPWLNDKKLKDKEKDLAQKFWNRYVAYLEKKIAPDTINKLDNLTDDILDRLNDPRKGGNWDKRGMVVGQVQSGKTSNYAGLINKAADSGYRLIIVLAGMHDSLRSQTQIRIDEAFIGRNTQIDLQFTNTGNKIGVGLYNKDLAVHSLTSGKLDGDFNRRTADTNRSTIRGSDPVVAVIKKNGSILKNLISWLSHFGEKMPDGKIIIRDLPLLLIDDEADNASINVSKEKVSTINGCIRSLLSLFEQSAYVGYTATPFANIFIPILNEEAKKGLDLRIKDFEFTVGQDLFPKDFIINIPAPSNYIGPSKIFGLVPFSSSDISEEPLPIVRLVKNYDNLSANEDVATNKQNVTQDETTFISNKHKKSDSLPDELPESLRYAIKSFVLSTSARRVRKQIDVHNSMLIHISRFIIWQDRIATLVDRELKFYQRQIEFKQGDLLNQLKKIWETDFVPTTNTVIKQKSVYVDSEIIEISWDEILEEIPFAISKIQVRAVHGDKNLTGLTYHNISPLDYFQLENLKPPQFLSIIAIGGDKLSRGLTLEGLTVSYYLRASKMYDTLMQMGRWFGYRQGYADLCRIFTSKELISWYEHITIASEEMRRDFDYMYLLNKTPKDFGLKVRTHKFGLKITAANKFRYHHKMQLSYSGELEQTYKFKIHKPDFKHNYENLSILIHDLGNCSIKPKNDVVNQKYVWFEKNNHHIITKFLSNYIIGGEIINIGKLVDYINAQTRNSNLINWSVCLVNNTTSTKDNIHLINGLQIGLTSRTNISQDNLDYEIAKANILSGEHEMVDLTDDEIAEAKRRTQLDWAKLKKEDIPKRPSTNRIKQIRDKKNGLLLIYLLNPNCEHLKLPENQRFVKSISDVPIVGIAISIPENENDEKIEYAVNEQFKKELDYDDDFDLKQDYEEQH